MSVWKSFRQKVMMLQRLLGLFGDLNGLKTVNDEKGHEAGDRLLIRAASLLKLVFGDWEIYRARNKD
ncbi:MAG: diguanylate cyclase [Eubacterium sp.]|nr:diguanylate cyclase [Eubacterium sp.]